MKTTSSNTLLSDATLDYLTMEHKRSCPCCAFLSNDLFLPKSEILVDNAEETNRNESSSSSLETQQQQTAMMSTAQAWQILREKNKAIIRCSSSGDDDYRSGHHRLLPLVVDTHGHAHLEREEEQDDSAQAAIYCLDADDDDHVVVADDTPLSFTPTAEKSEEQNDQLQVLPCWISLTCAVQQADWDDCLAYAASNPYRMAAIGIHPWYLANLSNDWLDKLEHILQQHAGVMVGEIGLCKMARFLRTYEHGKQAALALQRHVFVQQLQLAALYQRPVSIHCVNQQGVLLDIFKEQQQQQRQRLLLPPAMALHSFTGTAHHVKLLLAWEATLNLTKEQQPLLYFGFSHAVNHVMCSSEKSRRQGREAICMVPPDRLLAESDLHVTSHILGGTVASIAYLAWALDKDVTLVAQQTRDSGLRFLRTLHARVVAST
jgi:Tat protein secretion system quality control protein TatD with DNase activity